MLVFITVFVPLTHALYIPSRSMRTLDADISAELAYFGSDFRTHIIETNAVEEAKHKLKDSLDKHKTNHPTHGAYSAQRERAFEDDADIDEVVYEKDIVEVKPEHDNKRQKKDLSGGTLLGSLMNSKGKKVFIVMKDRQRHLVTKAPTKLKVLGWWG